MNLTVLVDWKLVAALGASVAGTIFVSKMDSAAAEAVSIRAIDACRENNVARISNH